jgi:hypothetical protein
MKTIRASVFTALMVVVLAVALSGWTTSSSTARTPAWDQSLIQKEVKCQHQLSTPGYYSSLNGAEVADAQRSQLYPCADFLGSRTGPNQVSARASKDSYQGATFLNNREPGQLYLVGGDSPPATGTVPPGPYVAKVNPTTGAQIWRTVLDNANVTGHWIANTNLNILSDGNIVEAWSHFVVLLDPNTGRVLKRASLPTGPAGPIDGSYKHLTVAPDGTLIIKQQNRPFGCTTQGSGALITCPGAGGGPAVQANSLMVAVNPKTLQVYDSILLPEMTAVPHTITMFHGKIAIYADGSTNGLHKLYRYFWNPETKKLSQDTSFVVSFLSPGQTTGDAPGILGDWIVIQTNGLPAEVPSSVVAINQDDPTKITSISPYGPLPSGGHSNAPPKAAIDVDNNMVYSDDQGVGKIAGIKFDRKTGAMTAAFVLNDTTTCLQALYGPANKRVLGVSNQTPATSSGTYTEQATFRDAATGQLLAQSAFFAPMAENTLITPAFGGGFYFPTGQGFEILQVEPANTGGG